VRVLGSVVLAILVASASLGALLYYAYLWRFIGRDAVAIQLYGDSIVAHTSSSARERRTFRPRYSPTASAAVAREGSDGADSPDFYQDHPGATDTHTAEALSTYIPAWMLSERPQLRADIDPEWYLFGTDMPATSAMLLINEFGDVDDLIVDFPSLTPMLLEDLRNRFRSARFTPGRQDGQPVKTMLRIMIRLD
jgi:hypothetical protein